MIRILAASAGILAVSLLPRLPSLAEPVWLSAAGAVALILLLTVYPRTRWLGCFCIGAAWGILAGHHLLSRQLPPALEGQELLVRGVVSDLPENRGRFQRFEFTIDRYLNLNHDYPAAHALPRRVLLSWYGRRSVKVAEQRTFKVKLSRPRGFVNRGGFDYQRWLLSRGIGATGYVRSSSRNELHGTAPGHWLPKRRQATRQWLAGISEPETGALLTALAVGDSSGISPEQWQLLRTTGTSHLMAISGLHVGLVALLGFVVGHGLRAAWSLGRPRLGWAYWLPGITSVALAAFYSAMAGFALPTQRALTMVVLVTGALMMGRGGSSVRALAWAMLIVLLIDPLSGYDLGFWLSFGAVAFLLYRFQNRRRPGSGTPAALQWVTSFGRAQWVIFLGLTVPLFALNQPLSLLSPLANLLAIPLVSFLVVGPLLSGLLLSLLSTTAAEGLVRLAGYSLELCMGILQWLSDHLPAAGWHPSGGAVTWLALGLATAGVLLLLSPRGLPGRWLGMLMLAPLLLPRPADRPPLAVTVLDVGQGLAVVVTTPSRVLVYDTGPAYSERFNAGDAIVGPYLRARGIQGVDRLMISHGDADHAGGAEALLDMVKVEEILSGEELPALARSGLGIPVLDCREGGQWQWDRVSFRLLNPSRTGEPGNNSSCILVLEFAGWRILIPGDIEAKVEKALLADGLLPPSLDLLIAPHHGSITSSSPDFVEALRPAHVVYSAGYGNRYGHPHPDVRVRYAEVGSQAYNTGEGGQLDFRWDRQGRLEVTALRQAGQRYWFDALPGDFATAF